MPATVPWVRIPPSPPPTLHTILGTGLADNKIALNAGWDLEILKLELAGIAVLDVNFDLSLTGFASGEIDVVLKAANDPDDEIIPAVPAEPKTQPGDIWVLRDHRIGCGDGRDVEFLRRVVGSDSSIDAAFMDPPCNVGSTATPTQRGGTGSSP